jgi:hypothetical protein
VQNIHTFWIFCKRWVEPFHVSSEPPHGLSVGVLIGGVAVFNGLVRGQVVVAAKDCQRALAVKHDEGPCPPDVCRIEG